MAQTDLQGRVAVACGAWVVQKGLTAAHWGDAGPIEKRGQRLGGKAQTQGRLDMTATRTIISVPVTLRYAVRTDGRAVEQPVGVLMKHVIVRSHTKATTEPWLSSARDKQMDLIGLRNT